MDNRRNEYLDKVLEYMVEDTKISFTTKQIYLPFVGYPISSLIFPDNIPYSLLDEYLTTTYGLNSYERTNVMLEYRKIISYYLKKSNRINESVNRKSDYLDKVVEFMIDDTEYNIYTNTFSDHSETKVEIWFPSSDPDEGYDYSIYDIYDWSNGYVWGVGEGDMDYVCSTYSICDINTVQELYNRYIQKLSTTIYEEMVIEKNGGRINESVDRKSEYLDKIVEFLVDDTKVLINDDVFFAPFYRLSSLSYNLLFRIDYPASFSNYTKDMYGLSDDDKKYVWDTYTNIIIDKFNSYIKDS